MTDIIMNILQWAIPSGGIGAAIAWIANRKVKNAEADKRVHDIYKQMYEDLGQEQIKIQKKLDESAEKNARAIEELNKENARIRKLLNRLSRAIEAIQLCPHRASCPVASCGTVKMTRKEQSLEQSVQSADSASRSLSQTVSQVKTTVLWTQPIASDTVRLSIPTNNLLSLPQGASYNSKHGRANVKAYVMPNDGGEMPTIIIEASCDSLQQLCLRYESERDSLRSQVDLLSKQMETSYRNNARTEQKKPPDGVCVDLFFLG